MTWRFADGTTVELGGKVEGATLFAQILRDDFETGAHVTIWPEPAPALDVDTSDAAMLNAYLERMARLEGVRLVEAPERIPNLPPSPYAVAKNVPSDAIY